LNKKDIYQKKINLLEEFLNKDADINILSEEINPDNSSEKDNTIDLNEEKEKSK